MTKCPSCGWENRVQAAFCDSCGAPLRPLRNDQAAGIPKPAGGDAFVGRARELAALASFNFWRPAKTSNYGELLPPTALPALQLSAPDGKAFSLESLRGKWLMLHVDYGACGQACRTKLYNLRQSRIAQGKHLDQVERVFLVLDEAPLAPELAREFAGTHFLRLSEATPLPPPLRVADATARIFLVDPIGQLMMRYPPEADPSRIVKDLKRLLKVSAPD
jgi:cytochrome oxidase Cu insertion factor (SCO1/SenC/PrrC family)